MQYRTQGRTIGRYAQAAAEIVQRLQSGEDLEIELASPSMMPRGQAADALYDRVLDALQRHRYLIVESHMKSRRTILLYSSAHGALTFKIKEIERTKD